MQIGKYFQMLNAKKRNLNHPCKGARIKVEPIRDLKAIAAIKANLAEQPRNLCLFTLGINTAYRAGELLSINVGMVSHLKAGDRFDLKQSKTGAYRAVTLNRSSYSAIQNWLAYHPCPLPHIPLFISTRGIKSLTVGTLNNLVKKWCDDVGLHGNYGSHSLRKSWGYQQRIITNAPLTLLMKAFGHSSETQTLGYLCIQSQEIEALYTNLEL